MKKLISVLKKIAIVFLYIVDISAILLCSYLLLLRCKAEIEHDELALIGLIGMVNVMEFTIYLVIAVLFFILLTTWLVMKRRK